MRLADEGTISGSGTITMLGTIETLRGTYGFIRGDDRISRFFIPSSLSLLSIPSQFADLCEGMRVEFIPIDHSKGPRAIGVRAYLSTPVDLDEEGG